MYIDMYNMYSYLMFECSPRIKQFISTPKRKVIRVMVIFGFLIKLTFLLLDHGFVKYVLNINVH